MTIVKNSVAATIVASAAILGGTQAFATSKEFTVYAPVEAREAHFTYFTSDGEANPHGEGKANVGDVRYGSRGLFDQDGMQVGTTYYVDTLLTEPKAGEVGKRDMRFTAVFEDGAIIGRYLGDEPVKGDFANAEGAWLTERVHPYTIVGGTGVFAGATGVVDVKPDAKGHNTESTFRIQLPTS